MAQKRMISQSIFSSARFLKMPISSQALYAHLVVRADDDGIVEAFSVMRITGNSEDDLRILVAKQFVVMINNDELIAYIVNWLEQNTIRADRKTDSRYQQVLLKVMPDVELVYSTQRSDRRPRKMGQSQDSPMTDMGPHRLEQISIEQISIETTTDAHTRSTLPKDCQDVNSVNKSQNHDNDVVGFCEKMGLKATCVPKLIEKYGKDAVLIQLQNLCKAKNVKHKENWLRAALRDNYASTICGGKQQPMPKNTTIDTGRCKVTPPSLETKKYMEDTYSQETTIDIDSPFWEKYQKLKKMKNEAEINVNICS